MAAILSTTDTLRRDKHLALDDNQISYSTSSIDWRAKYNEVADMLAETRAELDDFHHASKELEAELENELQRTESAQQALKVKVAKAEAECDDWKAKFMSLQTNYNTTTASLQRELDKLRQEHQQTKVQLRDLEMGNDDLERNERAVSSSLADMETKYSRALEEKILLEHELLEKASVEEESQRLRDELRDANVEISILKDQISVRSNGPTTEITSSSYAPPAPFHYMSLPPSDDDLLNTPPPPDLQLDELSTSSECLPDTPKGPSRPEGHSTFLQRTSFQHGKSNLATPPSSLLSRSSTLPALYSPSTSSPRTPIVRPPTVRNPSSMSTMSSTSTTSKNKGVQMVSEMRARVRNLEQKIHTRVPRLRMGSITGRPNANSLASSIMINGPRTPSSSSSSSRASTAKTSWDSLSQRRSVDSRRSNDSDSEANKKVSKGDSSGWVLIMEDSPSPPIAKEKEGRRVSSPSAPTAFRPAASTSIPPPTLTSTKISSLGQSTIHTGLRRPQSRLSAGNPSTATASSLPAPSSRPATPTFLHIPSSGQYAHTSTAGMTGLKRSTGPGGPNPYSQAKRSSLGSEATASSPTGTLASNNPHNSQESSKAIPRVPGIHSNVTIRPSSKLPSSGTTTSSLAQSRIGRPSNGALSSRKSTDNKSLDMKLDQRARLGSTTIV